MLRTSVNPHWPAYLTALFAIIAIVTGAGRYVLLDRLDSKHCHVLKMRGRWLDHDFKNWQPEGCMMHNYKPTEVKSCLSGRRIIFAGDSTVRKLFFQFAHLLDSSLPTAPPDDDHKHSDHVLRATSGNKLMFYWDPFLNSTAMNSILTTSEVSNREPDTPALLVLGGGLWYLRYADQSGGLPAWEVNIESILSKLTRSAPANEVVILPVQEVDPVKLSEERGKSMRLSDIDAMNSDLFHRVYPETGLFIPGSPIRRRVPLSLPLVFNKMLDPIQTDDGLHYSDSIVKTQATLLLNLRCNDALPKRYPFDKTCCNSYPWPSVLHSIILLLSVALGPVCWALRRKTAQRILSSPYYTDEDWLPLVISVSLASLYVADRTSFWLKEQKQFHPLSFGLLNLIALGAGLATVKKGEKDLGFLNRDQTDEWKGWMQIAILIYHYLGGSKISGIYNPIRVLVASYLFQTGYGHTTYYLKKADFGFLRVAQVMIRLNFLTVVLAYTMNTDYLFYYFAPLCSIWYLVIYVTLYIGHRFNSHTPFLVGKILLSAAMVTWFMKAEWPLAQLFSFLERFFAIKWSAREWAFRVTLDLWIVYIGMAVAILFIKIREQRLTDHPQWPTAVKASIVASFAALLWFFAFELYQKDKFAYNGWHPYVSFIPVLAFIVLRNASVILRSSSSKAFIFIGKCSLETFIIQYHFWLAGDTQGILQIIPDTKWRPINAVLTSVLFIFLSHQVALATGAVTEWFCGSSKPPSLPTASTANSVGPASTETGQVPLINRSTESTDESIKTDSQGPQPPRTPLTPRWLDRLASGGPPQRQREEPASWGQQWKQDLGMKPGGLGLKLTFVGVGMWITNLLWS